MTVNIDDTVSPVATLDNPLAVVALLLLLAHFALTIYLFMSIVRRKLDFNTSLGKLSYITISLFILWQELNAGSLFYQCPKLITVLAYILAAELMLANTLGLMNCLPDFSMDSTILTETTTKFMKVFAVILHLALIGPFYVLLGFMNSTPPFSIDLLTHLYQIYTIVSFAYMVWQFLYMSVYMHRYYETAYTNLSSQECKDSMKRSFCIILGSMVIMGISLLGWLSSGAVAGVFGHILERVAGSYVGAINSFAVLLYIELKSASDARLERKSLIGPSKLSMV